MTLHVTPPDVPDGIVPGVLPIGQRVGVSPEHRAFLTHAQVYPAEVVLVCSLHTRDFLGQEFGIALARELGGYRRSDNDTENVLTLRVRTVAEDAPPLRLLGAHGKRRQWTLTFSSAMPASEENVTVGAHWPSKRLVPEPVVISINKLRETGRQAASVWDD